MDYSLISDHSCTFFDVAYVEKHLSCIVQGKKLFINQPGLDSLISLFDAKPTSDNDGDDDDDGNSL